MYSNDGAQTVHHDEEVNKLMTIFANSYNIKPHNVGFNTTTPKHLATCGDFEVHRVVHHSKADPTAVTLD